MVGDDLYDGEDEPPPLPADLAPAVDEVLSEFDDVASLADAAARELLWPVLERVGRLDEYWISETMGGWTVEDVRDEEHRRQLIEEERRFVGHCACELDGISAAAIAFALALWIQCSGQWEDLPKQIDNARGEIVSELQISVAHPGRRFPLEATKRDVEASLSGMLWRVASEIATSAHELATSGLQGVAGTHDARQRRNRDLRGLREPSNNGATARRRTLNRHAVEKGVGEAFVARACT